MMNALEKSKLVNKTELTSRTCYVSLYPKKNSWYGQEGAFDSINISCHLHKYTKNDSNLYNVHSRYIHRGKEPDSSKYYTLSYKDSPSVTPSLDLNGNPDNRSRSKICFSY